MTTFKKHFPLASAVGLIVLLWTLIVGVRTSEARAVLNARLTEQRQGLGQLREQLETLQARLNQNRELDQRCREYERQLPAVGACDAALTSIRQLADVNTLTLAAIRSLAATPSAGAISRNYRLQARGSFNAFYAFLTQLETSSPSIVVSGLQLTRLSDSDADVSADMTVQLLFQADTDAGRGSAQAKE